MNDQKGFVSLSDHERKKFCLSYEDKHLVKISLTVIGVQTCLDYYFITSFLVQNPTLDHFIKEALCNR